MSVYTPVSRAELTAFLADFDVGPLADFRGIEAGIENTNYFVTTRAGRFVLTLFETIHADELPWFLGLMGHLAARGVPAPAPLADRDARVLRELKGRPAALVRRLSGASVMAPAAAHCRQVGAQLAGLHLAGADYAPPRPDPRGHDWRRQAARRLLPRLDAPLAARLRAELQFHDAQGTTHLPGGVIHADLFRDNVLFEEGRLSGLLDFYYACTGAWVYDLAITVNDWCSAPDGRLDDSRCRALLDGYHATRPLSADERLAWPWALRASATRFWVSRLLDLHFPREGALTQQKDPAEYARVLGHRARAGNDLPWPA